MKSYTMKSFRIVILMSLLTAGLMVSPLTYSAGDAAPDEMTGLKVGETVPDFALNDQHGKEQSLEGLLAKDGTTVLVFHRSANW